MAASLKLVLFVGIVLVVVWALIQSNGRDQWSDES